MARSGPDPSPSRRSYKRTDLDYASQEIAFGHARGQLAYYRLLERKGHMRFITTSYELRAHFQAWSKSPETEPLGVILSMEGADGIVDPGQTAEWWKEGLRVVGPVHYGISQYAHGTSTNGPLSQKGVQLLKEFERTGMILDVTHLSDQSLEHALDVYSGPVLASHHNCRAIIPGDRQLSDSQIRALIGREAVIGTAFDAWMLHEGWKRGETPRSVVSIQAAADHIDHICQLAGSAAHCALGTDLDGGFGTEQTPEGLDRYSDLHKLEQILESRGYSSADIDGIFYLNWQQYFERWLP
jgi:membrane dipeptidase